MRPACSRNGLTSHDSAVRDGVLMIIASEWQRNARDRPGLSRQADDKHAPADWPQLLQQPEVSPAAPQQMSLDPAL